MNAIRIVIILTVLLAASPAQAQTVPPNSPLSPLAQTAPAPASPLDARLGFVNMQAIFSQSDPGKQAIVQVKALQDQLNLQLESRLKEIQSLDEKIATQSGMVEEATRLTWNRDLARLQREAQFARQEAQHQVEQLQEALLASFQKRVVPLIDAIRAERGLTLVFAVQASEAPGLLTLIAADPRADLSAEVVARLNALR